MKRKIRVLVCPLDWGLGHATRCIPIIRRLCERGCEVIIGADKRPLHLLKQEFPHLEFIVFPGAGIRYSAGKNISAGILLQVPKILAGIWKEHRLLGKILREKKIDLVISDNRYGLWNSSVYSIFITHQLMIRTPVLQEALRRVNWYFIKKFRECWVPDTNDEENLSGELSHCVSMPLNVFFMGPLSRYSGYEEKFFPEKKYDILVLLSGPEPQRSLLEKLILSRLRGSGLKACICRGTPEHKVAGDNQEHDVYTHVSAEDFSRLMRQSELVICRPGYSVIMDLALFRKKAVFIPTPGQTEQEYLAEYFFRKGIGFYQRQQSLDLPAAIEESKKFSGFTAGYNFKHFYRELERVLAMFELSEKMET